MRQNNDFYALTLYDNNEEKLKHVWFDVELRVVESPGKNSIVTVTNIWKVKAMVDTGATISAITSRMITRMGLKPSYEDKFSYAKGNDVSKIYIFDVIFPGGKVFKNIEALEIDEDGHGDFLIGMNIISQGDIALTSVGGKSAFSFRVPPAEKYIDFEKDDE
jgi:predicted aspartyl protease